VSVFRSPHLITEKLIGYKLRKHISKALARRSAAIRTALANYNALTPLQKPPRPILQYSEVASFAFLGDFTLLKHSRHDVVNKPWAVATNRDMALKYFKIVCAHSEIHRLNIEIRRLQTWVDKEDAELLSAANTIAETDAYLASEVHAFRLDRKRVNDVHRARLRAVYNIKGYTGLRPFDPLVDVLEGSGDGDVGADLVGGELVHVDEDDSLGDEITRLMDCLENITV
jgi:hypothetical protein